MCKKIGLLFLSLIFTLLLISCSNADKEIPVAVIWPWEGTWKDFGRGVDIAVKEINTAGGVHGMKIKPIKMDDHSSLSIGLELAHQLSQDDSIHFVIGHMDSYISVPTASIYNNAHILMISPASTSMNLTNQGYPLVFRFTPNAEQYSNYLASYLIKQNYKNVFVYYSSNEYGNDLARAFGVSAKNNDIHIVDQRNFLEEPTDARQVLSALPDLYQFDAILIFGTLPASVFSIG